MPEAKVAAADMGTKADTGLEKEATTGALEPREGVLGHHLTGNLLWKIHTLSDTG